VKVQPEVEQAFGADNHLGETPVWSELEQALWWVNCEQPAEILRWSPQTGEHRRWPMPRRVGGFVLKASGGLLVALADGLYDFTPETGDLTLRLPSPLPDHVKLHECQCDRQGRFWIGAFDHHFPADRAAAGGAYFRLDGDRLTPVIEGIAVANGLAFSPDGRTLYAHRSPTRDVDAFDLDPATGTLSNRRTFLTLEPGLGFVDGATVDEDGGYWLAVVGAGLLRRYAPDGALDLEIDLPFSNPTKPAFGGADLATLYVTSTQLKLSADARSAANGGLFSLRPGRRGVADTPFDDIISPGRPFGPRTVQEALNAHPLLQYVHAFL
jgi:sugar lactone lactonase YvrE